MKQLPDRDDMLTRDETAVALTAAGYPIRSATLGTKATRGGGPPCRRFGTRSVYRWGDAIDWAEGRMAQSRTDGESEGARSAGNRIDRIAPLLKGQGFKVERRHSGVRNIIIVPPTTPPSDAA